MSEVTSYRNIRIFTESGVAREVRFQDGMTRYEHNVDHAHHDHLTCQRWSKTAEVFDLGIEELQEKLAESHDFIVTGHALQIYGLCGDCRRP